MENITYDEFIQNILDTRGRFACGDEYHERHHILPKCLGGGNEEENLIDLFAREHFIAHKLLAVENPDNDKLTYAYTCMSFLKNDYEHRHELSPEEYEEARSTLCEITKGEGNPFYGKHHSDETKSILSKQHTGMKASSDAKEKMRRTQTERFKDPNERVKCGWIHTEEQKIAQSKRMSGANHPMYGKHLTEDAKEKIREKHKKENLSEEVIQKYRDAAKQRMENGFKEYLREINTGKTLSEETRRKISIANKGKKRSEETKRKMSESRTVTKIIQYNKCGEFIKLWDSAKMIQDILHISPSKVYACCNKIRNSAGGFVWRKENEPLTQDEIYELKIKNEDRFPGVSFNKRTNRWQAYIRIDGKHKHIGTYMNKEEAIKARLITEEKYKESHGEFK